VNIHTQCSMHVRVVGQWWWQVSKQFEEGTIASAHVAWKYSVKHWKIVEHPSKVVLWQHQDIILCNRTFFQVLRLHFRQKDLVPYGFGFLQTAKNNISGSYCYHFLLGHTCTNTHWTTLGFLGRRFHHKEKYGQMDKWVDKPKLREVPGSVSSLNQALGSMMGSSSIVVKSWNLGTWMVS